MWLLCWVIRTARVGLLPKTNLLHYFPLKDLKLQAQPDAAPSNLQQPAMPNESCQVYDDDASFDTLQQDRAAVDFDQ